MPLKWKPMSERKIFERKTKHTNSYYVMRYIIKEYNTEWGSYRQNKFYFIIE